eukprot:4845681-Amphidinium_carterae.1
MQLNWASATLARAQKATKLCCVRPTTTTKISFEQEKVSRPNLGKVTYLKTYKSEKVRKTAIKRLRSPENEPDIVRNGW